MIIWYIPRIMLIKSVFLFFCAQILLSFTPYKVTRIIIASEAIWTKWINSLIGNTWKLTIKINYSNNDVSAFIVVYCIYRIPHMYLNPMCPNLTHWGRMTHICVSKLTIIGSNNGLSPGRRQAIFWTNAEVLLIEPSGTNLNETLIEIHIFSFKKMHLKMSSGKCRPSCFGLNVLI